MNELFEILAEPNRRRILEVLRTGEHTVSTIVEHLEISQPGVSRHLRLLREAGLVEVRAEAQLRIYSLRVEPLTELDRWLEPYRAYWNRHLDALERHLDATGDDDK